MSSVVRSRISPEGVALLEWFNCLPTTGTQEVTVDDLSDGSRIWAALQQLDPDFFTASLPEEAAVRSTGKWLSAWGNLKYIYKYLADHAVMSNGGGLPNGPGSVDLKEIAKGGEPEEIVKARLEAETNRIDANYSVQLLQLLLFTAINASENEEFISALTALTEDKQLLLQNMIIRFQEDVQAEEDTSVTKSVPVDKDLFFEEQIGRLTQKSNRLAQEKRDLQQDVRDLYDRNSRLQEHNSMLQEKLTATEEKLEGSAESLGQSFLKEIDDKVHQQEELIANQETQLADAQRTIDSIRLENNKFRASHEKYQPLQDEFDELKAERDQLARKANTIDKYKQKLQTMQDAEKEINHLKNALEESREVNREGNKAVDKVQKLQEAINEYNKVIPAIEQSLHEQSMLKKQSEYQAQELKKQLDDANQQYTRDQARIEELIVQLESGSSRKVDNSLESELMKNTGHEIQLVAKCTLGWTRLTYLGRFADIKAQNEKLLKSNHERDGRITMLESMLAVAKQRNATLEEKINEAHRTSTNGSDTLPEYLPGSDLLANSVSRDEARRENEQAELEKERALFQRKLKDEEEKGKQFTNFATIMEEMAEHSEIVVINKSELSRLQENAGAFDELQAKGAENVELHKRIKDLEVQVEQHQLVLSDTLKSPVSEETLKLIEAATRGATSPKSSGGPEMQAHSEILLEALNKSQSTVQEKSKVGQAPSGCDQTPSAISTPSFPKRSIVRPRPALYGSSSSVLNPPTSSTSARSTHTSQNSMKTSKQRSWLPGPFQRAN